MAEWQPIETAPNDGENNILVYGEHLGVLVVYWDQDGKTWGIPDANIFYVHDAFTHWMPVPDPPNG